MLNLFESMEENTQHIFTAEQLSTWVANDGYLAGRRVLMGCSTVFEPCTLYTKDMGAIPAFIAKKGPGPYTWTKKSARMAVMAEGAPVIFTNGEWMHNDYAKSLGSNLCKKFTTVSRKTMICVRNISGGNPDRVHHDIFKVVEVVCE